MEKVIHIGAVVIQYTQAKFCRNLGFNALCFSNFILKRVARIKSNSVSSANLIILFKISPSLLYFFKTSL